MMKAHPVVPPTEVITMPPHGRITAEIRIAEDRQTFIVAYSWQLPLAGVASPLSTSHPDHRAMTREDVIRWAIARIRRDVASYTAWNGGVTCEDETALHTWLAETEASLETLDLFEVAHA